MKTTTQIWDFFASVKLAIFTLCALSLTSIIGTVIPQGEHFSRYVNEYGSVLAQIFQVLDIPTMYSSWWFRGLLGILCTNLIVCSIDRFPTAWRLITADQLSVNPERLKRMDHHATWTVSSSLREASEILTAKLHAAGWPTSSREEHDGIILASQKGAWSRLGVYIVHLSILAIFAGGILGSFLGFKGTVQIPETESTDKVFASGSAEPIDLGFAIRCNSFDIEFYDNGMPKEYRSHLTVLDKGKEVRDEAIEVNKPLSYKGITFYQSSYEGYKDFLLRFTDTADNKTTTFKATFQNELDWSEKDLRFGVINVEAQGNQVIRTKIWLRDGDQQPLTFWLKPGEKKEIQLQGKAYSLSAKQMYATGLQVAKDPGVWLVYIGCGLMLAGLYMAFFLSHRRIWLSLSHDGDNSTVVQLAASTNKNKTGFSDIFSQISRLLTDNGGRP